MKKFEKLYEQVISENIMSIAKKAVESYKGPGTEKPIGKFVSLAKQSYKMQDEDIYNILSKLGLDEEIIKKYVKV